jgi:hypothetical protein
MFKKVGDNMPIINHIDDDGIVLCPECQEPLVVIAMDQNGDIETVCKCEYPELEELEQLDA